MRVARLEEILRADFRAVEEHAEHAKARHRPLRGHNSCAVCHGAHEHGRAATALVYFGHRSFNGYEIRCAHACHTRHHQCDNLRIQAGCFPYHVYFHSLRPPTSAKRGYHTMLLRLPQQ